MINTYFQISVNIPTLTGVFDYHVPDSLEGQIVPGCLVVVPFGRQLVQGIVLAETDTPAVPETRPIDSVLDPQPVVTPAQVELARWISHEYLAPLSSCLDAMLPPGLGQQSDTLYTLNPLPPKDTAPFSTTQKRILALLKERGSLRGRQIDASIPRVDWKPSAGALVKRGWLSTRPVLPPPSVRPKTVRTAQLAIPPAQMDVLLQDPARLGRAAAGVRRAAILRFLLQERTPVNVAWVYAASSGKLEDLYQLADQGLVILGESEIWRDPLDTLDFVAAEPPVLTHQQQSVWDAVQAGLQDSPGKPFLLHGVTSSGKTEIYLRAVEQVLAQDRQAIIMVPEIALTPQTLRRFVARFPGQVGVMHSRLSPGERYDTWRRARLGQLNVIVGPRSALFTPLPRLGLIVLDECHDDHFYQSDNPPVYSALEAAIAYARQTNSALVLGSATPPVELVYRARRNKWHVLDLPNRIYAHVQAVQASAARMNLPEIPLPVEGQAAALPLPPVRVVDMRLELKAGNRSMFSRLLQKALQQTLETHQQAILFLNRRGSATYVFCRDCGFVLKCPKCDLPLTFHLEESTLLCHSCNYRRQMPKTCPQCGSTAIRQYGAGTEKVEAEVRMLFPNAGVLRWDAETARQKGAHDLILSHFSNHRADILVGTQMIAKGLDLPLVTLVGVVLADVGLNFPDYRAGERAFQLLTQVAGRAGRSPLGGQVLLQTFQPEAFPIRMAARHDYEGFYQGEIQQRERLGYPPFSRLARLEVRRPQPEEAEQAAQHLAGQVTTWIKEGGHTATEIIGPVPCFFERQAGDWRWQLILRGPSPAAILRGRRLEDVRIEVDPPDLL